MNTLSSPRENPDSTIGIGSIVTAIVFFIVESRILSLLLPSIVSQALRPILICFLVLQVMRQGEIPCACRHLALITSFYITFVNLFVSHTVSEFILGLSTVLFLLMFYMVCGVKWNLYELRLIVLSVFLGAFLYSVICIYSNDMRGLDVAAERVKLLGFQVNRNLCAYSFSLGSSLRIMYIMSARWYLKLLCVPPTLLMLWCMVYSSCRGAFLCLLFAVFSAFAVVFAKYFRDNVPKAILFLIAVLVVGAYYLIGESASSRLLDYTDTSGRDEGIRISLKLYTKGDLPSKLFGHGFLYESQHVPNGLIAHTVYTNFLLGSGLVGVALLVSVFITSVFRVRGGVSFGLYLFAMFRTFVEQADYSMYLPLILGVILYHYAGSKYSSVQTVFFAPKKGSAVNA